MCHVTVSERLQNIIISIYSISLNKLPHWNENNYPAAWMPYFWPYFGVNKPYLMILAASVSNLQQLEVLLIYPKTNMQKLRAIFYYR